MQALNIVAEAGTPEKALRQVQLQMDALKKMPMSEEIVFKLSKVRLILRFWQEHKRG